MKQASRRNNEHDPSIQISKRVKEGFFILLCSLAIYLLIALMTYHHADPAWSHSGMAKEIHNAAGMTGAWFSDIFLSLFGYTAYIFPLILALGGVFIYRDPPSEGEQSPMWLVRIIGIIISMISSCGLIAMHIAHPGKTMPMSTGGLLGSAIKSLMVGYLNPVGTTVILLSFCLIGITLFTGFSWLALLENLATRFWAFVPELKEKIGALLQLGSQKINTIQFPEWGADPVEAPLALTRKKKKISAFEHQDEIPLYNDDPLFAESQSKIKTQKPATAPLQPKEDNALFAPVKKMKMASAALFTPKEKTKTLKPMTAPLVEGLPSLALLEEGEKSARLGYTSTQLQDLSRLVETRLLEFGVDVKVVGVLPGPVITRFELDLAAGIKVNKITGLAKDLARSLSVVSVRVVEVIPGKSVVGLEIPNVHRELVRLKEVLEDVGYQQASSPLSLVLGKDISGKPVIVDLAKMPHLLVAGTTGSGKSVGLNAMLLSILYKATPQQVRMILIDPKMLELAVYDEIPHLLTPVVTDMKDAANALRWCVAEMERRYQLMAKVGVRNLAGYNAKVESAAKSGKPIFDPFWHPKSSDKPQLLEVLPFVVVVVDEFADMMMVVGKKVEELIARIAQKARAAGIHLILATQRPSVDVITGLIKANIPTRIAFQVSSRIDSRTIFDQSGAEQLLGHGDMLYLPPGMGVPYRIHGAFVSDEEVNRVTHELRELGKPTYIENVVQSLPSSGAFEQDEDSDELYDQAVVIVTESRKASISLVQRRLKVGYNRAARLIERMEAEGVVSAMQSNGTREVLVCAPPVE